MSRYGYEQLADHAEIDQRIVAPHGFDFDPQDMRELIDDRARRLSNRAVPVISSEILSGQPFFGGLSSDIYASRIKAISGDARILVSIRSQTRILVSVYMQYLLRGGTMAPKQFFDGKREIEFYAFRPDHFEYDKLVDHYQTLFGADCVHVTTQESLKSDVNAAAARIAEFSGNAVFAELTEADRRVHAKSYPEYAAPVLRRINHVQTSALNPNPVISLGQTPFGLYKIAGYVLRRDLVAKAMANYRPVTDHVEKAFAGHYTRSNARLRELLSGDLDLSAYA